jgi:imidazolonepropionase-like amidohydrolase
MTYIFENARIFDGMSSALMENASILVEDKLIVEVSDKPLKHPAAERIDCSSKTLMPGLIDNHVHIYFDSVNASLPEPPVTYRAQYANLFLRHILACGFTTVRDVAGGDHGMALALRRGLLEGPRYFYGGLCLTQTGGHADLRSPFQETDYLCCAAERNVLAIHADGVDECIKAVREELRKGASHIKIMASGGVMSPSDPLERSQYSDAEIRAIVDECTRRGVYVAAHCHPAEAIERCVELGIRSIEHGTLITEEVARTVVEKGAFVVPTLAVLFALAEDGPAMGMSEASQNKLSKVLDSALDGLEIMKRAGVKMGFGTDLLGEQHTRQGTEFSIRRRVLDPIDILRSCTSINAEILGMQDKLGVIKAGAFADLILVDGDPLEDIELLASNGRDLSCIMADGKFIKRTL